MNVDLVVKFSNITKAGIDMKKNIRMRLKSFNKKFNNKKGKFIIRKLSLLSF